MSGFTKGIANPMATEPTLLAPLSTVSGSTTSNSTTLVLDMQTYERVAITDGLIGSGMFLHTFFLMLLFSVNFMIFDFILFNIYLILYFFS